MEEKIISNNFNRNKERYIEGKHYICLEGQTLKEFKTIHHFGESSRINRIYLWTQKGALLHAKSLNTDKAWEAYEYLIDLPIRRSAMMGSLSAPIIIDSLAQAGFFQRKSKRIKDLEKKIEELEKERK